MKICSTCRELKDLANFTSKSSNRDGLQDKCRKCKKDYNKKYYEQTKERHNPARLERTTRVRKEAQAWARAYLEAKTCMDCGESDIRTFDFDHVRGKTRNISDMIHTGVNIKRLEAEAGKCEVVCANCHRIRTYERSGKCYKL